MVKLGLGGREATAAQNRIEYKGQAANASESCLVGRTDGRDSFLFLSSSHHAEFPELSENKLDQSIHELPL